MQIALNHVGNGRDRSLRNSMIKKGNSLPSSGIPGKINRIKKSTAYLLL